MPPASSPGRPQQGGANAGISRVLSTLLPWRRRQWADSRVVETYARIAQDLEDHVGVILWESDVRTGRFSYVSPQVESILGYPREQWILEPDLWRRILQPEDREYAIAHFQAASAAGREQGFVYRVTASDGRTVSLRHTVHVRRDARGRPQHLHGLMIDLSRHHLLERPPDGSEEQVDRARRMQTMGRLAGGIAHDLNNVLTAIRGYTELASRELVADTHLRPHLAGTRKAVEWAAALTRQILLFSRNQIPELRMLDVNGLVAETSDFLQRIIGEDIVLETILGPEAGRVRADPGQLQQVLLNLAVNARDAMPDGGRLIIATSRASLDERYAGVHRGVAPGRYVLVEVSDTGAGMDEATRARVFEPFFTSKKKGEGTGLGLATSYGIIKRCGGNIWVYSEPGRGTTVKVYLPLAEEQVEVADRRGSPKEQAAGGSETVLVVEDDAGVRGVMADLLRGRGYSVLEASGGEEALAIVKRCRAAIDLVIIDIVMPGMSGCELAILMENHRRVSKFLYMSGYPEAVVRERGLMETQDRFLSKPFAPDDLALKVREILDTPVP